MNDLVAREDPRYMEVNAIDFFGDLPDANHFIAFPVDLMFSAVNCNLISRDEANTVLSRFTKFISGTGPDLSSRYKYAISLYLLHRFPENTVRLKILIDASAEEQSVLRLIKDAERWYEGEHDQIRLGLEEIRQDIDRFGTQGQVYRFRLFVRFLSESRQISNCDIPFFSVIDAFDNFARGLTLYQSPILCGNILLSMESVSDCFKTEFQIFRKIDGKNLLKTLEQCVDEDWELFAGIGDLVKLRAFILLASGNPAWSFPTDTMQLLNILKKLDIDRAIRVLKQTTEFSEKEKTYLGAKDV